LAIRSKIVSGISLIGFGKQKMIRGAFPQREGGVNTVHRMVYEDREGEERNPIVNGYFTLAPPPSDAPPASTAKR
jgi:hypothetical protein